MPEKSKKPVTYTQGNIEISVEGGDMLIISIPLKADRFPSKSGKTEIIGTTGGNMKLMTGIPGELAEISLGVNCYIKNPDYVKPEEDED